MKDGSPTLKQEITPLKATKHLSQIGSLVQQNRTSETRNMMTDCGRGRPRTPCVEYSIKTSARVPLRSTHGAYIQRCYPDERAALTSVALIIAANKKGRM